MARYWSRRVLLDEHPANPGSVLLPSPIWVIVGARKATPPKKCPTLSLSRSQMASSGDVLVALEGGTHCRLCYEAWHKYLDSCVVDLWQTLLPPPTRQTLCDRSFFCLSVCLCVILTAGLLTKWKADFIETRCYDWPTSWKNWFAFGGALVPDTDSGSFFHFPHHCRIGDFRSSGTTKSVAPGGKTLNGAPTPSPPPSSLPSPPNSSTSFPSLSPFPSLPSLRSRPP